MVTKVTYFIVYLIGTIEGIWGNMGSCDILLTRIFVNKIIIKSLGRHL